MVKKQGWVIWIPILYKIFILYIKTDDIYKDIKEMLKQGLILKIMKQIDHCLKEKIRSNWINKR